MCRKRAHGSDLPNPPGASGPPAVTNTTSPVVESIFGGLTSVLALFGAVAIFLRMMRGALSLALRTAEIASAGGMAEASARRGDLTGLSEANSAIARAKGARTRKFLTTLGWGLWLVVPLAMGWVPEAWAVAAPLWLLGGGRVRPPEQ